jgi:hypothetical protein
VSNKSNLRLLVVLLFAAFATAALAFGDFGALAQNTNSSTTGDASMQSNNSNGNMGRRSRGRRRRGRGRRRAASTAAAAAAAEAGATGGASQTGDVSGEQTDLSGTYTGHITMSGGHDMDGDGTLTITGNQFSLAAGGMTHNGRIYAVTPRGYTGASLYFPDITNPATNTPLVANARAKKSGDRLWLMPVPGTQTKLTFGSGGGGGGRRGRRGRRASTMAPPAEATGDASATGDATTGAAAGTGDANANTTPRRRRGSRRRRGTTNTNANTNTNTGDNSNAAPPM